VTLRVTDLKYMFPQCSTNIPGLVAKIIWCLVLRREYELKAFERKVMEIIHRIKNVSRW